MGGHHYWRFQRLDVCTTGHRPTTATRLPRSCGARARGARKGEGAAGVVAVTGASLVIMAVTVEPRMMGEHTHN
ncbi:hypothetical protein BC830DRAFT_1229667 [Chytriomyces sp. MP71]|nr:hypothetical protein BC830DRAFT_1229667 [Chytriomyces sp. MP71]